MRVVSWVVCLVTVSVLPVSAQVRVEKTTWEGHEALTLSNGTVEVVITTGIGPRVIRYGFVGGENALGEIPGTPPTKTALGEWKPWGGHRLWVDTIELWTEGAHRVHDRAVWKRSLHRADESSFAGDAWRSTRLNP